VVADEQHGVASIMSSTSDRSVGQTTLDEPRRAGAGSRRRAAGDSGMGHDLPEGGWSRIAEAIAAKA
jgi:hypothetical protein